MGNLECAAEIFFTFPTGKVSQVKFDPSGGEITKLEGSQLTGEPMRATARCNLCSTHGLTPFEDGTGSGYRVSFAVQKALMGICRPYLLNISAEEEGEYVRQVPRSSSWF